MGLGIVYGVAWWTRNDVWYGLAAMAWYMLWYMVWLGRHCMVYGMACSLWAGIVDREIVNLYITVLG